MNRIGFRLRVSRAVPTLLTVLAAVGGDVAAQNPPDSPDYVLDSLVVSADRALGLNTPVDAGSRVGLTVREVPATLNLLTGSFLEERGLRSVTEAYNATSGLTAGNIPGSPATTSTRGFTYGATQYIHDGVRAASSDYASRNWDTWGYESIEVLKGPSSMLYGVGALAASINLVPKKPTFGGDYAEAMLAGGSFGGVRTGLGANKALSDVVAVRADGSFSRSSGYVDDTEQYQAMGRLGLAFQPSAALREDLTFEFTKDDFSTAYFGQPLIGDNVARDPTDGIVAPGLVLDRAIRNTNYDVTDGIMDAQAIWLRSRTHYQATPQVRLQNDLSYYTADRHWSNAEDQLFNSTTGLLDRYTTIINHDHQYWANRLALSYDGRMDGVGHRASIGADYANTSFFSPRRFGTMSSVDPFNPARQTLPADNSTNFDTRVNFDTGVQELGAFLEEAFNVTPRVLLIGGVRYDHIVLDRTVDDLIASTTTTFDKTWNQVSWRAGAVLDATPETQVYAQYSSAMLPVSGFLTMSQSRAAFDLSRGRQVEGGIKSSMADGRVAFTAAAYWIAQDKILTRDPSNPALTIQGGEQSSIGGELSVYGEVTDRLRLDGNLAVLDAKFDELVVGGGTSLKGNTPLNVPERVGNVSLSYAVPGVPVAISLTGTSVGKFFTDDFNTIEAKGYQLLGASIRFDSPLGTLVARGRNLMDEYYVAWSGYYETHVYVGEPRSFEVSWTKRIF